MVLAVLSVFLSTKVYEDLGVWRFVGFCCHFPKSAKLCSFVSGYSRDDKVVGEEMTPIGQLHILEHSQWKN